MFRLCQKQSFVTVCWVKRDKNGNKSQFKSFKRDKSVGTFVGTLKIEKT